MSMIQEVRKEIKPCNSLLKRILNGISDNSLARCVNCEGTRVMKITIVRLTYDMPHWLTKSLVKEEREEYIFCPGM